MPSTTDTVTVLCLFHDREHAQAALSDLQKSEVPANSISVIGSGGNSTNSANSSAALQQLGLPSRDLQVLTDGVQAGGTIIVVSGQETITGKAESIFGKHRASQIDEKVVSDQPVQPTVSAAAAVSANDAVIPVVEEELLVGKRQVKRGGVRVYSRMVETPVEESITLQEEHATLERHPVNRPITGADVDAMNIRSIEVTESEEVPVVEKSSRVVEEVLVGKETTHHTEQISDTVRKTQVEIEEIEAGAVKQPQPAKK